MQIKPIIITILLLASLAQAQSKKSFDVYAKGQFSEAFVLLQNEMPTADPSTTETLLDMALDVFAQSQDKMKVEDVLKVYDLAQKKKLNEYLSERVKNDSAELKNWSSLRKETPQDILKKIQKSEKEKDPLDNPNHAKKSRLRVYALLAQSQGTKDPWWVWAQIKAEYALSKGGLPLLQELAKRKNLPADLKTQVKDLQQKMEKAEE